MRGVVFYRRQDIGLCVLRRAGAPGPGEVVLEIKASGLCGSDLKFYRASKAGGFQALHGPLCNQLMEFLKKPLALNKSAFVTKNMHVDVAIVDRVSQKSSAIFEIKTSALPSDQVYSAIGQMLYYKFRYGHSKTKLYLVLPSGCKSNDTEIFIESLGIAVVYGESGEFKFSSGKSLNTDM